MTAKKKGQARVTKVAKPGAAKRAGTKQTNAGAKRGETKKTGPVAKRAGPKKTTAVVARSGPKKATAASKRATVGTKAPVPTKAASPADSAPSAATRAPGERRYWLLKTEPGTFSYDDLERAPERTTGWDGVRNFQARNYLRDQMRRGDLAFIYHSGEQKAIVGIAEIASEGHPDRTALDPTHPHFDPQSDPAAPTWMMVDVRAVRPLARPLTLSELRTTRGLESMVLLQRGSRLSVQPVSAAEWGILEALGRG